MLLLLCCSCQKHEIDEERERETEGFGDGSTRDSSRTVIQAASSGDALSHHDAFLTPAVLDEQLLGPHCVTAMGDSILTGQDNDSKSKSEQM